MASMSSQSKPARLTLMDDDQFSKLPEEIIERILSRLPIKDMARTSVLSTKWRYRWASVPSLVFDDQSFPLRSNQDQGPITVEKLASQIDRILLFHLGPVHKFKLSYLENNMPFNDIDKWIFYLSRRSIKKLVLRITGDICYDIPSSLFSCQSLTQLDLSNCYLPTPPSAFKGFNNLKSLNFGSMVEVTQEALEKFITSSTALERLTITHLIGVDRLNIHAPTLICLTIIGQFIDVRLWTSRLSELFICANHINFKFLFGNPVRYGNLITLMTGVPQISRLTIDGHLLVYLATGDIPKVLPVPCINLTYFSITVLFAKLNEVSATLCLLRSAPNLVELKIICCEETEEVISEPLELDWELELPFSALKLVTIDDIKGTKNEMDFIRFMLLTLPALRCMNINLFNDSDSSYSDYYMHNFEILKKILLFKRASTEAEFTVS